MPVAGALSLFAALSCFAQPVRLIATSAPGALILGPSTARVALAPVDSKAGAIGAQIASAPPGASVYLSFLAVQVEQDPEVAYNVYVNVLDGAQPLAGVSDPRYLGTLSLFDAMNPSDRAINITVPLRRLIASNVVRDGVVVSIVPAGIARREARTQIKALQITVR
jgi:hypothetical protein